MEDTAVKAVAISAMPPTKVITHLFSKHSLSIYCVPGTVSMAEGRASYKTRHIVALMGVRAYWKRSMQLNKRAQLTRE